MKWTSLVLSALIFLSLPAQAFNGPDQVVEEFFEPGHMPQNLDPVKFHPLDEVISKVDQQQLQKIKAKRKKKQKRDIFSLIKSPVSTSTIEAAPIGVDLRRWDSYVRSQWDGTCTAHGLVAGLENLANRNSHTTLSTRYFWSQYKKYSAVSAMGAALKNKQVDEGLWPQDHSKPKVPVSELKGLGKLQLKSADYLEDDLDKVVKSLAQGFPVYVAMSVPADMASCRASIRASTRVTSGGHALLVSGYQLNPSVPGGGYMILKNSWGSHCGDFGYQYMPFGVCDRSDMYCMFYSLKEVSTQ